MINSARIEKITELVDKKVVADVGADHGYISKLLFLKDKIKFAYLTDISKKCLQKAVYNFKGTQFEDKVCFFVGDGLEPLNNLKNKPRQIIIAGMGGNEIIKIISKNTTYNNFVLQPQKNIVELRKFLSNNNFAIYKDVVVKEGNQFYFVIKCKRTNTLHKLTDNAILFGKTNLKVFGKDFEEYLNFRKKFCEDILKQKRVEEKQKELKQINILLKRRKNKCLKSY